MNIGKCEELFSHGIRIYPEHSYVEKRDVFRPERDYLVLIYAAHGSGFIKINNKTLSVAEKDVYIVNKGYSLEIFNDKQYRFEIYAICLYPDALGNAKNILKKKFSDMAGFLDNGTVDYAYVKDTENGEIRNIIVRTIDEFMSEEQGYELILQSYAAVIFTLFFRKCYAPGKSEIYSQNNLVDNTIRYIHQNIYNDLSPRRIAAVRNISQEHLSRVFKENTGVTLTQYINSIRVKKVMDVLENTDRPIENIALLFHCHTSYLRKLFKKYTGMTMSEYRKKHHYK